MATFFRKNPTFDAAFRANPRYQAALRLTVETRVAPAVRAIADQIGEPWMPRGGAAITVTQDGDEIHINNTDYGAWIAEVGSVNNPAHAPLRRGVRNAGLDLREE